MARGLLPTLLILSLVHLTGNLTNQFTHFVASCVVFVFTSFKFSSLYIGGVEETVEAMSLYNQALNDLISNSNTDASLPLAALLSGLDLVHVSSSVLKAESWLRTQVLAH